jgi:hypothetical protein
MKQKRGRCQALNGLWRSSQRSGGLSTTSFSGFCSTTPVAAGETGAFVVREKDWRVPCASMAVLLTLDTLRQVLGLRERHA